MSSSSIISSASPRRRHSSKSPHHSSSSSALTDVWPPPDAFATPILRRNRSTVVPTRLNSSSSSSSSSSLSLTNNNSSSSSSEKPSQSSSSSSSSNSSFRRWLLLIGAVGLLGVGREAFRNSGASATRKLGRNNPNKNKAKKKGGWRDRPLPGRDDASSQPKVIDADAKLMPGTRFTESHTDHLSRYTRPAVVANVVVESDEESDDANDANNGSEDAAASEEKSSSGEEQVEERRAAGGRGGGGAATTTTSVAGVVNKARRVENADGDGNGEDEKNGGAATKKNQFLKKKKKKKVDRYGMTFVKKTGSGAAMAMEPVAGDKANGDDSIIVIEDQKYDNHRTAKKRHLDIKKYTLESALKAFEVYDRFVAIFLYDPDSDEFYTIYDPKVSRWEAKRFPFIRDATFESLRTMFPRGRPSKKEKDDDAKNDYREYAVVMASGDYPQMFHQENGGTGCFAERGDGGGNTENEDAPASPSSSYSSCVPEDLPPILQYGSVFYNSTKMPSVIAMPMPEQNHIGCFRHYANVEKASVCKRLQEKRIKGNPTGLVFPETVNLKWDDLVPQVVWRATDRGYLTTMLPEFRRPDFAIDVAPVLHREKERKNNEGKGMNMNVTATRALRRVYDVLVPRWKGIVWTAEAEREAEAETRRRRQSRDNDKKTATTTETTTTVLPWCNIKFATTMYMKNEDNAGYYEEFMKVGIPAIGGRMDLETLAKYKYHLDLGGGGGTTWSGTLEKLAMPGLLFHHMTPTRDYIHDIMEPWVHYVPLKEDLSDLRERYEWAESHPDEARAISERATDLIRWLGTQDGFAETYDDFWHGPLTEVVGAYEPLPRGESWREVIRRFAGKNLGRTLHLRPMTRCAGYGGKDDCSEVDEGEWKEGRGLTAVAGKEVREKEVSQTPRDAKHLDNDSGRPRMNRQKKNRL